MATHSILFSIMAAALVVFALATPILGAFLFKQGYYLGVKDYNASHKETKKTVPVKRNKKVIAQEDAQMQKMRDLLENIENYDGTSAKQKEID